MTPWFLAAELYATGTVTIGVLAFTNSPERKSWREWAAIAGWPLLTPLWL